MRTQFLGEVVISVPFALVDYSIPGLTNEQAEEVVKIAVRRALQAVIEGVSFGPMARAAFINVEIEQPALNCPCGGCVGVQTCSED